MTPPPAPATARSLDSRQQVAAEIIKLLANKSFKEVQAILDLVNRRIDYSRFSSEVP